MSQPDYFIWDINPELFSLGPLAPRYYGLLFVLGFLVGYFLVKKAFRQIGKSENDLISLLYYITFAAIIGARLGHILFYHPMSYLSDPLAIIRIWEGGLASHGGAIGVIAAILLFSRRHNDLTVIRLADILAPSIAFVACCVRLGNFFNSEILGKPSTLPWAVVFARVDAVSRHPAMLYEAASYLGLFMVYLFLEPRLNFKPGAKIGLLLVWIFSARFLIEFVKEQHVAFESHLLLNMGQLLSIPFVILGLLFLCGFFRQRSRHFNLADQSKS
jgi:phosphatidylglycerol---prolipoprotein diacylglyceryl transferase